MAEVDASFGHGAMSWSLWLPCGLEGWRGTIASRVASACMIVVIDSRSGETPDRPMSNLLDAIRRGRQQVSWRNDPDGDPGPSIEPRGIKVLVVYLFRGLGDAVLLVPAVKALVDVGAEVEVLVQEKAARILKLVDLRWQIHTLPGALDLGAEDPRWQEADVLEQEAKMMRKLASRKYDVAIELTARADADGRRWVSATHASHRLGWVIEQESAEAAGLTFGTPDVRLQTDRHWSRFQMLPMRCFGVTEPKFDIPFDIPEEVLLRATGSYGTTPRMLLVPGAQQEERRWPLEHFARVGRWVTECGGSVVVCGAPHESDLVEEIVGLIGKDARLFAGEDLQTLLALIATSDVVVTNDTGPMHFAFLLRVPTVAIFTWMSPLVWGPPNKDPRFVVIRAQHFDEAKDAGGLLAQTVIHHVEGLLMYTL